MKRTILLAALIAVFAAAFTGCKKESGGLTIKPGVLTVGMEIGYPPMEYLDADGVTPIGFDVALAKALADKMGLEVEYIDTRWDGIFAGVDTGRYDCIMSSVTMTPARMEAHNFSAPYIQNTLAIVLPKNSPHKITEPAGLAGLGVAYQEETTSDHYMTERAGEGMQFTPYEYEKVMNCFDELSLGRVDAIMTDLLVAYEYVGGTDSPYEIVWQGGEEEFGVCMKKGNAALTEAVNKALDEMFADGSIQKISNDIFGMDLVSVVRE